MGLISTDFASASLARMHSFNIFIPDFINRPLSECNVIMLLHGIGGNRNDWVINSNALRRAEECGCVLIMPEVAQSFYINTFSGERYGDSIKELLLYCRKIFRISDKRENTFIVGASMGGYGAMRIGFLHNDLFSRIGSFSGSLDIIECEKMHTDGSLAKVLHYRNLGTDNFMYYGTDFDLKTLADKLPKENPVKLFLSCGKADELYNMNKDMYQSLKEMGMDVTFTEDEEGHNWQTWGDSFDIFMRFIEK